MGEHGRLCNPIRSEETMRRTLLAAALALLPATVAAQDVKRGEYLARIMDCGGCHTPGALAGAPDLSRTLHGSTIGFEVPGVGIVFPPNLTPDVETGLGDWSNAEIVRAIKAGIRPDGRELAPIMPWRAYAALDDADAASLAAYLKSLPPAPRKVPDPIDAGDTGTAPYLALVIPK